MTPRSSPEPPSHPTPLYTTVAPSSRARGYYIGRRHRPKLQSSPSLGWRSVSPGSHVVYDNDHRGGSDREQQSRKLKCLADLHACTTNFQPSWVQVTNLRLLVDYERNKLWRIGDAAFRLLTVCLNTGFIAFTFYQAMDSISGLNLLTVLAFGRNEAVKKAGAAPPDCDHPSMFNEQECFSYVRILLVQVVIELLAIVIMWAQLLVAIATSRNLLRIKVTMLHISGFSTLLFSPSNMLVQDLWRFVWTHLGPRYIEPAPAAGVTRLHRRQGVLASRLEVNMLKLVAILTWSVKALLTTVVFAVILLLTASFLICKLTSLSFAIADSSLRLALFPILSYVAALNQLSYAMDVQWSDGALEHLYQSYPWLDSVTKGSRHPYVTGLRAARRRRRAQVTVFRRRILEGLIKLHGRVLGSLLALSITVQDEAFIAYFPANAAAGRRFFISMRIIKSNSLGNLRPCLSRCIAEPSKSIHARLWNASPRLYTTNTTSQREASESSRYFGHRTHKKICPDCGLPNLLPSSRCIACGVAVGDADIKPVGQHDPILEAVMVAKPTPKSTVRTTQKGTAAPVYRFPEARSPRIWHADFDTLVMDCPWPSSVSGVHVLGVVKSSRMYDVRCLNRKHLPLLDQLHLQCVEALRQALVADKSMPTVVAVELLKHAQFGFRYPSEFSILTLHALCPPFEANMGIFAPPYWMSFKAVRDVLGKQGKITDVSKCLPSSSVVGSVPRAVSDAQAIGLRVMDGIPSGRGG